ncbi:MarR family EPS-associated transcriptional regulator [Hydrogenovibrio sp. SC-1]|uniref:MarR family EPS-associated transcriptional regulator n=1 Tax=Hydrogenovibrio sp. SC-1 TaxID=2065820 RepID=UPI000C7C9D44|nr:MarR family EPS-associated transcriptional regulator [Hydrogenovibrio sp. SC-1]PLA75530.1 MarR family EPS-associated transcriptional regulator [Hydrogenovibrio sp. SC-1]
MTPENQLQVLRYLDFEPNQRTLAQKLGFSLGKTNYVLKCLMEKGLVKAERFAQNSNKLGYRYVLTPKGLKERIQLTEQFICRKRQEYDELSSELQKLKAFE